MDECRSIEIEVDGVFYYLVLGGTNDFYLKFADNSSMLRWERIAVVMAILLLSVIL